MVLAMGCYILNDTFVKLATARLPPGQIMAVRGVFAFVVVVFLASATRTHFTRDAWRSMWRPIIGVRCMLEVTTALTSVAALALLPLALLTAFMMTAPFMIGAASAALGWEPWNRRVLAATAVAFVGVLLVVGPTEGMPLPVWGIGFAILCVASLVARDLVTRQLPAEMPSAAVAILTTGAVGLAGFGMGAIESWPVLERSETAGLAAAAVCTAVGNYALIASCRGVDLSVVTPFRFSIIVWAVLLSYLVWGEIPQPQTIAGIALIVVSGFYAAATSQGRR